MTQYSFLSKLSQLLQRKGTKQTQSHEMKEVKQIDVAKRTLKESIEELNGICTAVKNLKEEFDLNQFKWFMQYANKLHDDAPRVTELWSQAEGLSKDQTGNKEVENLLKQIDGICTNFFQWAQTFHHYLSTRRSEEWAKAGKNEALKLLEPVVKDPENLETASPSTKVIPLP